MALRLNLHHEIAKQKALNRRDPLKLSIYGLAAVALCFAGYYAVQLSATHSLRSELAAVQSDYDRVKNKAVTAQKREEELATEVKLSEALVKRVESRFYWATVLESVSQIVPPEIQITKFAGDVANDKVRHCKVTLEGLSAGTEPRKVAEELRRTLAEKFAAKYKHVDAKFGALDDGKETARLAGRSLPTAVFAINLQMQLAEDEAPPPPRRAPAAKKAEGGML